MFCFCSPLSSVALFLALVSLPVSAFLSVSVLPSQYALLSPGHWLHLRRLPHPWSNVLTLTPLALYLAVGPVVFDELTNAASPLAGTVLKTDGATAWDAGAQSAVSFDVTAGAVSGVRFRPAQTNRNFMVGLTTSRVVGAAAVADYRTLDYAAHLTSSGDLLVWSNGALLGRASSTAYRTSDTFRVAVNVRGHVEFVINDVVRFTASTKPASMPLTVRVVLFDPQAQVVDVLLVDKQAWCRDITCASQDDPCLASVCVAGEYAGIW